jgi:hypothetical protein
MRAAGANAANGPMRGRAILGIESSVTNMAYTERARYWAPTTDVMCPYRGHPIRAAAARAIGYDEGGKG